MTYRNVVSAVVRALAAETMTSAGGDFEPKIQCAKQKGAIVGKEAALLNDCIVNKLLHAGLSPRQWNALVAKYSTHKANKLGCTAKLIAIISTTAPHLFLRKAVTAWAIPQIKGIKMVPRKIIEPEVRLDAERWRVTANIQAAKRAAEKELQKCNSRSSDMVVLADSNYDMATWDNQGLTERTYRRWNQGIRAALENLVNEALVEAQLILELAGILGEEAA
ncbi:hypothetical protein QN366_04920 [Pseudomonas sp. CCC3.2]|uniref:hypothetical protein n=1 Tax=unclassified Pseudomonas TaxID=196821 RepID=UPI002AB54814|nr:MULTISPECIES: hypothetical protein [unclassified Pseudomonas]MDY7559944.1 hypothetical protein [Pseudomonas sp. AB6]MEB0179416.1 hypothetical protein [Pseudomonas sp. CCC3.2]MEB0210482.1 hypothetical protein [Pseudomonas sp. AB6]